LAKPQLFFPFLLMINKSFFIQSSIAQLIEEKPNSLPKSGNPKKDRE